MYILSRKQKAGLHMLSTYVGFLERGGGVQDCQMRVSVWRDIYPGEYRF